MLQNNIELDLKTKLIESGTTQTEVAEKVGVSLAYVNRITKGREQIVNKTFVKMMDELGYDVELTYRKKTADWCCGKSGFLNQTFMSNHKNTAFLTLCRVKNQYSQLS